MCTQISHTQLTHRDTHTHTRTTHTHFSYTYTYLHSHIQKNYHMLLHTLLNTHTAVIYFYCYCAKTPDRKHFREERFILAHRFKGISAKGRLQYHLSRVPTGELWVSFPVVPAWETGDRSGEWRSWRIQSITCSENEPRKNTGLMVQLLFACHLTSHRKYSEGYFVPLWASSSLRNSLLLMTLRHLSS